MTYFLVFGVYPDSLFVIAGPLSVCFGWVYPLSSCSAIALAAEIQFESFLLRLFVSGSERKSDSSVKERC